jgi:hypothetical protein
LGEATKRVGLGGVAVVVRPELALRGVLVRMKASVARMGLVQVEQEKG